jgi:hypothetical protein
MAFKRRGTFPLITLVIGLLYMQSICLSFKFKLDPLYVYGTSTLFTSNQVVHISCLESYI